MSSVQSQNSQDVCQELLDEYTTCSINTPDMEDQVACTKCITNYSRPEQYDPTSCDDVTIDICSFYIKQYFSYAICTEEIIAYYTCSLASTYAPENCTISCAEVLDDDSNGVGEGGNKTVDEQKNSTSAASTKSAVITMTVSASTLLVVAGALL